MAMFNKNENGADEYRQFMINTLETLLINPLKDRIINGEVEEDGWYGGVVHGLELAKEKLELSYFLTNDNEEDE